MKDFTLLDGCASVLGVILLVVLLVLLMPFIVMASWNHVMPVIFGLPVITYAQSFWLYLLITTLFGNVSYSSKKE